MGVRRLAMPATVKSSPPRPLPSHRRTAFPRSPLAQTKGIGVGEFEMPFPDAIVGCLIAAASSSVARRAR